MSTSGPGRAAWVGAAALASACVAGPSFVRPAPPKDDQYTPGPSQAPTEAAAGVAQRFDRQREIRSDWWHLFGCGALDALMDEALQGNPNVKVAQAGLRRSQELLRAGYGAFFPSVNATGSAARERFNPSTFGQVFPGSIFSLFTAAVSVSYSLDIWGAQRRAVETLAAQVDAQHFSLEGTYLTLESNVANSLIARAGYAEQIALTEQLVHIQEEQVAIAEVQARAGTAAYLDVISLKGQLASLQASLPPLRQRAEQAEHVLAVLLGRSTASGPRPKVALADFHLPAELPLSLPSALVRQRPDVLLAEAQLHAATAQVGVATAALLPSLSLSASYGTAGVQPSLLFTGQSVFWNLGAGLTQPLFRGGTLWFQRKAAVSARDEALAQYEAAVLAAFQQVADALTALQHDAQSVLLEAEASAAAEEALRLVHTSFQAGTAAYTQVLLANAQYQQAKLGLVQAQSQRLQDTVALYAALGGGWWNRPQPLGAQVK